MNRHEVVRVSAVEDLQEELNARTSDTGLELFHAQHVQGQGWVLIFRERVMPDYMFSALAKASER